MTENNRSQEIADALFKYINPYLEQQTAAAVNSIDSQRQEFERSIQSTSDDLARRFGDGINRLTAESISKIETSADDASNLLRSVVAEIRSSIEDANAASERLRNETAEAERKTAEALAAEKSAREEREKADKASATLSMQSQVVVERLTREAAIEQRRIEVKHRRKAEDEALRSEEEAIQDEYDAKENWLQIQIGEQVPEIRSIIENLVEAKREDREDGENDGNG